MDYEPLTKICQHPILTTEETKKLGKQSKRSDNAFKRLVECNVRLVVKYAKRFLWTGIPLEDLVSAGVIGLIQAVEKYDPERPFIPFAKSCIYHKLLNYIRCDRLIKIPQQLQHKMSQAYSLMESGITDTTELAINLGIKSSHVRHLKRLIRQPVPLEDVEFYLEAKIKNLVTEISKKEIVELVLRLLKENFEPREYVICMRYWGFIDGQETYEEISQRFCISRARVHQIYKATVENLREHVFKYLGYKLSYNEI